MTSGKASSNDGDISAVTDWHEYLMMLAHAVAMKSKDTTKVGCVIVGQDHEILATGFNGAPIGVNDRLERPAKYLFTAHSEVNAVSFAARNGHALRGSTAYVTHHPCSACARSLIQAGICCVVIGDGVTHMDAVEFEAAAVMFKEANVNTQRIPDYDRNNTMRREIELLRRDRDELADTLKRVLAFGYDDDAFKVAERYAR